MTGPLTPTDDAWKQRVQDLEKTLQSREAILDSLPDHVVIQDVNHRVRWANRAACQSLGLDRSSVMKGRCHELWCSQADPCPDCPMPEAMQTGAQVSVVKTTPDGRIWRIRCTPLADARGAATTMIEVTEEITERMRVYQAQQEAEGNRKLMLDTMQEMLAYHDTELRVKWANRAAAESVGQEVEDLVGRHCYEIWQRRDTPCDSCPVLEAMETGRPRETEAVTPDGRVYRIRGYPIYDENGRLKGAVEYGIDITESKRAEEALKKREAIFRAVFEQAPCAVLLLDPETGEAVEFNEQAYRMLGYSREAFQELRLADIEVQESPEEIERHTERLIRDGEDTFETRHRTRDGRILHVLVNSRAISLHGKPYLVSLWTDITEQKQAEEAIREREARLRVLFESAADAMYVSELDGRVVQVNEQASRQTGYREDELLQMNVVDIDAKTRTPEELGAVFQTLSVGRPLTLQSSHRKKDGSAFPVEITISLLEAIEGPRVLGIARDISERKEAEEALKAQHAKLKSLFDYSGEAIALLDTENRIQDANRAFEEVFGYALEEARGQVIERLICPERFYPESGRLDRQSLAVGGIKGVELIRKRKDGTEIDVRASAGPIKAGEDVIGRFVVFDDISDQKKAAARISLMAEMLDDAPGSITVHDTDGRFLYANQKTFDLHGYDQDEFMAVNLHDLDVPATEALLEERFRRIAEDSEASFEVAHFRKDGTAFPLTVLAKAIDWQGMPAVLSIAVDISERKMAEEALQRVRFSIENLTDTVLWVDENGHFTDVNEAACRRLGYSREEMLTLGVADIDPHYPQGSWPSQWEEMQRRGVMLIESEHLTKNGDLIPMELVIHHQVFGSKRYNCVLGRDISERRKAEAEREKLEAQLRQSQKMEAVGTLAGGIAHDFNNILGIIVGNAELSMMEIPEWSPAQECLQEVRQATLRARELVTQILLFARQKEQVISRIHVGPIARESLKMLRASIPSTVDIRHQIEEGALAVLADPSQIQQIIMNLCTNAAQVLEAEGGTLTFTMIGVALEGPMLTTTGPIPKGRYLRLQVSDTGPGISPDHLERIFDPFFTTKGVGEGTGLGLAVVHGIVQGINGGIHVESREGQGTTFSVFLPASEAEPEEGEEVHEPSFPRGTERILFVDDEPMILKLGQRMLERQGYRVETRASGTDALACFRQNPDRFDLVITDMTMPAMRGDRLAGEILDIRPDVPVILCTGFSKQISEERARSVGVRAFVMKPLTHGELARTVRRVLDEEPPDPTSP